MTKAHAVPVPFDSLLMPLYAGADLLDAYAVQLPVGANEDIEVLARAGFERQAWWIRALTRLRDVMMLQWVSNHLEQLVLPLRREDR